MTAKASKEVIAFATEFNRASAEHSDISRKATMAAATSRKHKWTADDTKWSSNEELRGVATVFFCEVLAYMGTKVTKGNVDKFAVGAHPVVRDNVAKVLKEASAIHLKNGGRVNNIQDGMLREFRSTGKMVAAKKKGLEIAKKVSSEGTPAPTTAALALQAAQKSYRTALRRWYDSESADLIVGETSFLTSAQATKAGAKKRTK